MGKAKRKPRPSPARYYWWISDGCWDCKDRNNCNQCKRMKEQVAEEKQKRKRKEKERLRRWVGDE